MIGIPNDPSPMIRPLDLIRGAFIELERERAAQARAEAEALSLAEYVGCRLAGEAVNLICEQYGFAREEVERAIQDGCAVPAAQWAKLFETPNSFASIANFVAETLAGASAARGLCVTIH